MRAAHFDVALEPATHHHRRRVVLQRGQGRPQRVGRTEGRSVDELERCWREAGLEDIVGLPAWAVERMGLGDAQACGATVVGDQPK